MGRCIWVIVTYPRSFSRFRCTVSEKLISEIFSHFPFFSKSVHPVITILLWELHHDDRNMLNNFQIDLLSRLGEMAKTSSGSVKIQQQQLEAADLSMEMNSCNMHPARGHLHKENNQKIISQALMQPKKPVHATMPSLITSQQPFDFRYATETRSSIAQI